MPKTYAQIQEQIASLQRKAEAARQKEIAGVVKRINAAIRHYRLAPADLDFSPSTGKQALAAAKRKAAGTQVSAATKPKRSWPKVAPKYRDEHGNTWAARGSQPRWLRAALAEGRTLESFAV